ncbi:M20/M25/M40 family metallo-hydrolase [Jiangella muralis]|uniref:M20/M25/M40 family metallo-hydrolase n=1 Tax=Jiangella muralis TaxID=702383 RepID=UPI00069D97BE|nr:M20/M25/M40 family metallo-hydrolase [Jiangella muralis]
MISRVSDGNGESAPAEPRPRVLELLQDLVAIRSVNPRAGGDPHGETAVAEYVRAWAAARGWRADLMEVVDGRHNAVVVIPGELPGAVLLQTHTDTVETAGMSAPFTVVERDGRCHGRGTCDAKGQLAVFMAAIEQLARRRHHTVVLAACVDEEDRFAGVTALIEQGIPAAEPVIGAVVGEPTELRCVVAHKGVLRGTITASGPGGHSSVAESVPNPIAQLSEVVAFLSGEYPRQLTAQHPLLTAPAMTVTQIRGGEAINLIPRSAVLSYDRRLIPSEGAEQVWAALRRQVGERWPDVVVDPPLLLDDGLDTPPSDGFVRRFGELLGRRGLDGSPTGVPFGSDASKLVRCGFPCVVFGAGSIRQAHSAGEYVPIRELTDAVGVIGDLLAGTS